MTVRGTKVFTMFAAVLALVASLLMGSAAAAQDASTPTDHDEESAYQANINAGTCDALGDVVFELDPVIQTDDAGTPQAADDGSATPSPAAQTGDNDGNVAEGTTTIEASLEELVSEEHVITLYQDDDTESPFACSEITGSPTSGALQIDLLDDSESGLSATAMLTSEGESTIVTILVTDDDIDTRETPEATPAS